MDRSTETTMDRFCAVIDAYGAEESRWPDNERRAMLAFEAANAAAANYRADAAALDGLLAKYEDATPSAALTQRIIDARPLELSAKDRWQLPTRRILQWGAIAATVVVTMAAVWGSLRSPVPDLADAEQWEVLGDELDAIAAMGTRIIGPRVDREQPSKNEKAPV